jgi:radical SAM-linked protein
LTEAEPLYRLRLTFAKGPQIKYIGHLDLVRAWERALRRARIPLAYSKGFNPQARVQVASALPVGHMGRAELMDIFLTESRTPEQVLTPVRQTLPAGMSLIKVEMVPLKGPSLQSQLRQGEYLVTVETELAEGEIRQRIEQLLAAEEVRHIRTRRQKQEDYNLRTLLHQLRLEAAAEREAVLSMRLSVGPAGNLRPESVLDVLGLSQAWVQVERQRLIFAAE